MYYMKSTSGPLRVQQNQDWPKPWRGRKLAYSVKKYYAMNEAGFERLLSGQGKKVKIIAIPYNSFVRSRLEGIPQNPLRPIHPIGSKKPTITCRCLRKNVYNFLLWQSVRSNDISLMRNVLESMACSRRTTLRRTSTSWLWSCTHSAANGNAKKCTSLHGNSSQKQDEGIFGFLDRPFYRKRMYAGSWKKLFWLNSGYPKNHCPYDQERGHGVVNETGKHYFDQWL